MSVPSVAGFPELIQASGISIPARAKFVTWCGQFAPLISPEIFLTHVLQVINVARNGVKNYAKTGHFFPSMESIESGGSLFGCHNLWSPHLWFGLRTTWSIVPWMLADDPTKTPKKPRSILMDLGTSRTLGYT